MTAQLTERIAELEEQQKELNVDMESASSREGAHLTLQQKISEQNARLTAENNTLQNKLSTELADYHVVKDKLQQMQDEMATLVGDAG